MRGEVGRERKPSLGAKSDEGKDGAAKHRERCVREGRLGVLRKAAPQTANVVPNLAGSG